jgi:hypothetical protein
LHVPRRFSMLVGDVSSCLVSGGRSTVVVVCRNQFFSHFFRAQKCFIALSHSLSHRLPTLPTCSTAFLVVSRGIHRPNMARSCREQFLNRPYLLLNTHLRKTDVEI